MVPTNLDLRSVFHTLCTFRCRVKHTSRIQYKRSHPFSLTQRLLIFKFFFADAADVLKPLPLNRIGEGVAVVEGSFVNRRGRSLFMRRWSAKPSASAEKKQGKCTFNQKGRNGLQRIATTYAQGSDLSRTYSNVTYHVPTAELLPG